MIWKPPTWIQTYTGKQYFYDRPNSLEVINLEDIAHSLSQLVRYTGHLENFYTVAEHSVHVARTVMKYKREALMHDATEAYLGDVNGPLKQFIGPEYKRLEAEAYALIKEKYHLWGSVSEPTVKHADLAALTAEAEQGHRGGPINNWTSGLPQAWDGFQLQFWPPALAKARFLQMARELNIED